MPIVRRELRTAARRVGTYWIRVAMAAGATLIGACILFFSLNVAPQKLGSYIFQGLAGLSMLFALSYGRQRAADCLSSEKREGTLGLLFLTDLKGHDVVLGKLAATSMGGFYGLMAIFPVLAIPLLMGGITNGEFWRIVLTLINTFIFSLSVAILVSAFSWDARRAIGTNFLVLLFLSGVPPAISSVVAASGKPLITDLFLPCPVYTFYRSLAGPYASNPRDYWLSLGLIHALSWLMLALAARIVPRRWQDRPVQANERSWSSRWRRLSFGSDAGQKRFRDQALDINAFYWLAARARLKPIHVWIFLSCVAVWWVVGWASSGPIWFDIATYLITAALVNTTLKIWLMIEAGARLAEDHHSGALEPLLSTPLSVADIARGQWLALRRQFQRPLIVVLLAEVILMLLSGYRSKDDGVVPAWIAGMVMLVIDLFAAGWISMWLALKAKNAHQATLGTIIRILVIPWLLVGAVTGLFGIWYQFALSQSWDPGWKFYVTVWVGFGLAADVFFGLQAYYKFRSSFRQLTLRHLSETKRSHRLPWRRNASHADAQQVSPPRHGWPSLTKARHLVWRRRVIIPALLALGLLCWWLSRPASGSFPKPLVISLSGSNAPIRVFPANPGVLIMLPDNSLWTWAAHNSAGATNQLPELLSTNSAWVKLSASYNRILGLRFDGTIWEWKRQGLDFTEPKQFDRDNGWVDVAIQQSGNYVIAIRKDGTLWEWGKSVPMQKSLAEAHQVGTNADWKAVSSSFVSTLALRQDGSLWVWGMIYALANTGSFGRQTMVADPTRLCEETNWTGFLAGYPDLATTSSAEAWELSGSSPNANAPAAAALRQVSTNAIAGHFAMAINGDRKAYELRPDGTLWVRACPLPGQASQAATVWRQVGIRRDWISIYSAGATAVGLTQDGMIWIWGYDPSQMASVNFLTNIKTIQTRLSSIFAGNAMRFGAGRTPVFQKEPRPIMQLNIPAKSK